MSVFEQYGMSVYRTVRGRGAYICETDQGIKLLRETILGEEKYAKEDYVTRELKEKGYNNVDVFCRTTEGKIIAEDGERKHYYLKEWFDAGECDVKNYNDVLCACKAIAMMHNYLGLIRIPPENVNFTRGEGEETSGEEAEEESKKHSIHIPTAESLEKKYQRKMKEMCSIRNYLRKKKRKTNFERMACEHLAEYLHEGEGALENITIFRYKDIYDRAVEQNQLVHGSCSHHNILIGKGYEAVVNFERTAINVSIVDLYDFMRKILEKYQWDIKLAYRMMDVYDQEKRITQEDLRVLRCLFSFPEKYFKVMNHYYNASKSWLPEKDMEKLKVVLAQNEARRRFVESLK